MFDFNAYFQNWFALSVGDESCDNRTILCAPWIRDIVGIKGKNRALN